MWKNGIYKKTWVVRLDGFWVAVHERLHPLAWSRSSPVITAEHFKGLHLWLICVCVRQTDPVWAAVCVCVCARTHPSSFMAWPSGPERNRDPVILGIWRQGQCHRNHRENKHDVKRAHASSHARTRRHSVVQVLHCRAPAAHVHAKHKRTHYATCLLLGCVWNERRVSTKPPVWKKKKKALPSLRDKHDSVTRFTFSPSFFLSLFLSQL